MDMHVDKFVEEEDNDEFGFVATRLKPHALSWSWNDLTVEQPILRERRKLLNLVESCIWNSRPLADQDMPVMVPLRWTLSVLLSLLLLFRVLFSAL